MNRILQVCIFITLISFNIRAQISADIKSRKETELVNLIASANYEMNGDFDDRQPDGSFQMNQKNHIEVYGNSCALVIVLQKMGIATVNSMEDFKNKQMEVLRYTKPNPEFKKLLDFLMSENLPLYHYFISKDGKYRTTIIVYEKSDLEQWGICFTE